MTHAGDDRAFGCARVLRAKGWAWRKIARQLGISVERLRTAIEPGFGKRRYQRQKRLAMPGHAHVRPGRRPTKPKAADVAARLAEIPDDERGLTQRLLGDPLPGRSALDRRAMP